MRRYILIRTSSDGREMNDSPGVVDDSSPTVQVVVISYMMSIVGPQFMDNETESSDRFGSDTDVTKLEFEPVRISEEFVRFS